MYSRTMLAIGISILDRRRDWAYLRSITVAFSHVRSLFVAAEEHGFSWLICGVYCPSPIPRYSKVERLHRVARSIKTTVTRLLWKEGNYLIIL
jgi:hypothetical protein